METQETLTARFVAQQDIQLTLIEKESTKLEDHIAYWESVRKEMVLAYYSRKEGYNRLGLQPLPVTTVSEYRAKEAIKIVLLLKSLNKSAFANEPWTLSEVSAEILNTSPKNCFKKQPFNVTVYFDNNANNSFVYTSWNFIYYEDDNNIWHKTEGLVDSNGLYYKDYTGDLNYFQLFQPDAEKYGQTGQWTVKFKDQTLFASISSASRAVPESSNEAFGSTTDPTTSSQVSRKRHRETEEDTDTESPTSSTLSGLRRRRREPRKSTTTTRGRRGTSHNSAPTPEEVGSGSRSLPRTGLPRLRRLQEEARDPPLIILKGHPNTLKCWRYRSHNRYPHLFQACSTVFHWVGDNADKHESARVLLAFVDDTQRQTFIESVTLPKGTEYALGQLNSL
uniref:Regulatory protein E2 n=1 Tax=Human papillomavirus TaxID=10566 RepID=A0A385PM20_9PAPI|nr:MAG: E2 protein [Human papillomavirus]